MFANRKLAHVFFIMVSLLALSLACSPALQAQNWAAMPPYNTLWPLWSPALSPVDPVTGLPTPIVTELTHNTILPVEPGLTWYTELSYPWLLYNTPAGMAYYDPIDGVNLWPPAFFMSLPLPLTLPPDYANLPPTDPAWLTATLPVANSAILGFLPAFGGAPIVSPTFLPLSALLPPLPPPLPIPTVVIPTVVAPTVIAPLPVPTIVAPTLVAPTVIAPLPVPTVVAPTILAPTAVII
ncbi:MAG: hypothetical protein AB1611_14235 [bacterium]